MAYYFYMTRRTENFNLNLGDKVTVIEIKRPGIIDSIMVDEGGHQYRVVYWFDGTRHASWVYEGEIKLENYE